MNTPETTLPSKRELLSWQSEWIRRAGAAALAGALIIAAGLVYQQVGLDLPDSDSDADQLTFLDAHSGRLTLAAVIQGLGILLFSFPLYFLFRSASARAERMRGAFAALIVVGPIAFGVGLAVSAAGSSDAADEFVSQEPQVVREARQQAEQRQQATPNQKQGTAGPPAATTTGTTPTGRTGTGTTGTGTSAAGAATAPAVITPEQAASDARENLADDVTSDSALLTVGRLISLIGALALVFGLIYTSIWSIRVGLLSRFMGALGIAFGVFFVIPLLPPTYGPALWFAVLGLMFIGVWPRPLPPAWAAGEAIPWQRPGDDLGPPPESRPPETVETSGREVSEPPLPEQAPPVEQPAETQGQRRKKRKRRK
jgi:hypothetical protein